MRHFSDHQWFAGLDWLAARPRGAAVAATVAVILIAALIRAPVIEGAMVDQMSTVGGQLQVSRRIQAASGGLAFAAVIVSPAGQSIAAVFADLAALAVRVGHHCAQPVMTRFGRCSMFFGTMRKQGAVSAPTRHGFSSS